MFDINKFLEIAIVAAWKAGDAIMEIYQSADFGVQLKEDDSPLTKADMAANAIIEEYLKTTGIPILSEEGKQTPYEIRKDWKLLWIVDPLDGTKEFINRNDEFTVNIALIDNQVPILGVVYAPVLKEMYFGHLDIGSFVHLGTFEATELNIHELITISSSLLTPNPTAVGSSKAKPQTLNPKTPNPRAPKPYVIVASRSHMNSETEAFIAKKKMEHGEIELISRGSSLKFCMMAQGKANCYPRFGPTMEWDTAAGQAVCMFAGIEVIEWSTQESMKYNRPNLLNGSFYCESK